MNHVTGSGHSGLVWSGERHRQNTAQSRPVNGSQQQCPTSVDLHTTVINQILQHRKTTTGLKAHSKNTGNHIFMRFRSEVIIWGFYRGELFSGGFQFVARVIYERPDRR
ncbi:hypothetical protein B5X24_HaOG208618 [Helicoverpa armigera]|nr:hypothetical protein B5X24_HaOG208618 [Helicoverpa armigera]